MTTKQPLFLNCKRQRVGVRNGCRGCALAADVDAECVSVPRPRCLVIDSYGKQHSFIFVLKEEKAR